MLRGRRFSRRRLLFGKVTESGPQGRRRFTGALMGFRSTLAVMICGLFLIGGSVRAENVVPVAQRGVLYDEDPSNPKGKQYVGSVVWRTEPLKATGNQKADIAVRADIVIPHRKFKMTISFRRNTDPSLPASHTVELTFVLPPDFAGGGVGDVPGILMKSNEPARGEPLAGLAVKVTDGFFLVGLSNVDADRQRNIQLLNERSWLDVPMVYTNQRRAILAIEKGPSGEQAFNDAFAFWDQRRTSSRAPPDSLRVENGGRVKMVESGGIYHVPVVINGALKLDFIVDSGASDVSIPADVVLTLMRTGTIKKSDFIGTEKYRLADGSAVESGTFIIRSLKVGDRTVTNVRASIADVNGPLLLGQSFLKRFKSWSQNNAAHELILE
jgi:predicted aspartyl protease